MKDLNEVLFLAVNSYANKYYFLDVVVMFFAEIMPYVFMLPLVFLWFSLCVKKKKLSIIALVTVLLAMLINHTIAIFYFHPRPFMQDLGTQLIYHTADSSFPSDHTTFTFAIAFAFLFSRQVKKLGSVLLLLSVVGGLARVFVGVHFPLDIVGAALVGAFAAFVLSVISNKTNYLDGLIQARG